MKSLHRFGAQPNLILKKLHRPCNQIHRQRISTQAIPRNIFSQQDESSLEPSRKEQSASQTKKPKEKLGSQLKSLLQRPRKKEDSADSAWKDPDRQSRRFGRQLRNPADDLSNDNSSKSRKLRERRHTGSEHNPALKPSNKVREHPSKEREKQRQVNHDRKERSWRSSHASLDSIEDPAHYFDEKWTHKHGRLSDWRPPSKIQDDDARLAGEGSSRRPSRHVVREDDDEIATDTMSFGGSGPSAPSMIQHSTMSHVQQHDSQKERNAGLNRWQFFATCHPGLEESVEIELQGSAIAAQDISRGQAGVTFW